MLALLGFRKSKLQMGKLPVSNLVKHPVCFEDKDDRMALEEESYGFLMYDDEENVVWLRKEG